MTAPRTVEGVRPVAGDHFRHVAALRMDGAKRRKLLALVAAYRDAGRVSVPITDLAARLDWPYARVDAIARRLREDGHLVRTNSGRWRLADEIVEQVKAARKAAER